MTSNVCAQVQLAVQKCIYVFFLFLFSVRTRIIVDTRNFCCEDKTKSLGHLRLFCAPKVLAKATLLSFLLLKSLYSRTYAYSRINFLESYNLVKLNYRGLEYKIMEFRTFRIAA